jgi:hypothetical protein
MSDDDSWDGSLFMATFVWKVPHTHTHTHTQPDVSSRAHKLDTPSTMLTPASIALGAGYHQHVISKEDEVGVPIRVQCLCQRVLDQQQGQRLPNGMCSVQSGLSPALEACVCVCAGPLVPCRPFKIDTPSLDVPPVHLGSPIAQLAPVGWSLPHTTARYRVRSQH